MIIAAVLGIFMISVVLASLFGPDTRDPDYSLRPFRHDGE